MSNGMKRSYLPALIIRIVSIIVIVLVLPASAQSQVYGESDPILLEEINWTANPLTEVRVDPSLLDRRGDAAPTWYSMFSKLPGDWSRGVSLTPQTQNVRALASIGVFTLSLMRVDNEMWRATRKFYKSSEVAREFSGYAVALGDGKLHLGIAGAFAGYGWLMDDSRALRTASQTVEAFLATGVAVQLLKRVTGRECPNAATHQTGRWKFFPHPSQYDKHPTSYYAYPSGHISTAMGTLTVIAENYPEVRWIKPVGYTMVGALGFGLVAKGMHWYSDLPLGIALGYLFGKVVSNPDLPSTPKADDGGVNVSLAPGFDGQGGSRVSLAVVF
jgi:membrane-associated phospholipid phosphatase